jgi:hypothetical protein
MNQSAIKAILGGIGVAAFSIPKEGIVPLTLVFIVVATAWLLTESMNKAMRLAFRLSLALLIIAVSTSALTPSVSIALVSAMGLASSNKSLAFAILFLQTSLIATSQAILANFLFQFGLEQSAPAITSCVVLLLFSCRLEMKLIIYPLMCIVTTFIGNLLLDTPILVMYASSVPSIVLASIIASLQYSKKTSVNQYLIILVLVSVTSLGWILYPPTNSKIHYVYIEANKDAPEHRFFQNYSEILSYVAKTTRSVNDLSLIPSNSLVIVPWISALSDESLTLLKQLSNSRKWTVILIGEHTNHDDVATRINNLIGRDVLRDDLTTPARNADVNGSLRSSELRSWPSQTIFNRGASVAIHKLFDRPLLEGDGWWAENNIAEWLWVGDYRWQPGDRSGRLTLSAAISDSSAKWVVVGDSSPFLNQQLLADPEAIGRFVDLATLWPSILRDSFLIFVGISIFISINWAVFIFLAISLIFTSIGIRDSIKKSFNPVLSFDERNFNVALASSPDLLTSGWKIQQLSNLIPKIGVDIKDNTIYFGLAGEGSRFGTVTLESCRRMGQITTNEGPKIMDAQACKVVGSAKILIGTANAAAALEIKTAKGHAILILDKNFIGKNAPEINASWLTEKIKVSND